MAETTKYRVKKQFTGKDGQKYEVGREYVSKDDEEKNQLVANGTIEEQKEGGE